MADASIPVIVLELEDELPFTSTVSASGKPFMAFIASNPGIRSDGRTEEEAVDRLRATLLSHIPEGKVRKVVDMRFDDLIVEEIMEG